MPLPSPASSSASNDARVADLLGQIAVRDVADTIDTPLTPLADGVTVRSGFLVRGAKHGGSPFLNFLTRAAGVLFFLVVLAVVGGLGWVAWRFWPKGRAPTPPVTTERLVLPLNTVVACSGRSDLAATEAVSLAVQILAGTKATPRTPAALRAVPGATMTTDEVGNRVDIFHPQGASLAVRYHGTGPAVQSVSVRWEVPVAPCTALARVGAILGPAKVQTDAAGVVWPVDGAIAPLWAQGMQLRLVKPEARGVTLLQIDAGAR